jgi:hypothetical protein
MILKKVIKNKSVPVSSGILKDFGKIDYCDSYQTEIITKESIDEITARIFTIPEWVKFLMRIRNSIVSTFGLKTGDKNYVQKADKYPVSSKAIFFTVTDRNENEIVMAENDRHLNFRVSVMMIRNKSATTVYLTTIVKFNNLFGNIYFFPVKPFHRIIIQSLLRRI